MLFLCFVFLTFYNHTEVLLWSDLFGVLKRSDIYFFLGLGAFPLWFHWMDYSLLSQCCPLSFGLLVASQSSRLLWSCSFTCHFLVELKRRVSPPLPFISNAIFLPHHICWQSFLWCFYLSHWLFDFELIFPWWISLCLYCWFSWFFSSNCPLPVPGWLHWLISVLF